MGSMFVTVFTVLITYVLFMNTFEITGMNRVILNTPRSIFETTIPIVQENEDITLYFDQHDLHKKLTSYYNYNLAQYVREYEMKLFYYNPSDDSYCVDDFCQGVEVRIKANLCFGYPYSKTMYYEIRRTHG